MKMLKLTTTAVEFDATPLIAGRDCVAVNFGSAAVTITDSNDSSNTFSVPAAGMVQIDALPAKAKASATCFLLGGV
jgi:hypothetical protein